MAMANQEGVNIQGDGEAAAADHVRVPAKLFKELVEKLKMQSTKLTALNNVHLLVQEKDESMRACKEKLENNQAALQRTEMRLAQVLKLQMTSATERSIGSESNVDSMTARFGSIGGPTLSIQRSNISSTSSKSASDNQRSDLEEDGCPSILPNHEQFVQNADSSLKGKSSFSECSQELQLRPRSIGDSSNVMAGADCSDGCSRLSSMTMAKHSDDTCPSITVSGCSIKRVMLSTAYSPFATGGGISQDLVDKLMHQNGRLKKAMRDVLNQHGVTISDYLVSRWTEY